MMLSRTSTGRLPASASGAPPKLAAGKKPTQSRSAKQASDLRDPPPTTLSNSRVSTRLNPPVVNPLGNKKHTTSFSSLYSKGGIPCRLDHGSVKHKVAWTTSPERLDYNPLFITFLDGLRETQHPYIFIVRNGLKELLDAPGAAEKLLPILPAIVAPLRAALTTKDKETLLSGLDTLSRISNLVGPSLNPYLSSLVPPIASRVLHADLRETVYETLRTCELAGGEQALKIIRNLCPTYSSIYL
ncbi:parkin co-regulated protein-domain-containing protein, partial [Gaertneriomyces semiglobifer]